MQSSSPTGLCLCVDEYEHVHIKLFALRESQQSLKRPTLPPEGATKGGAWGMGWRGLFQLFASVRFLVQSALAALHHINKIRQGFLLIHRNVPEVAAHRLCQLGFVQAWSGLNLVVPFIAPQCVHLKLEQIHLWDFNIMIWRLSTIITGFPLSLVADTLDEVFVEVADVQVSYALIDVQFQLLLRYTLLDPLAEAGVPRRPAAALSVRDQAAALPEQRPRSRRSVVAVFLRAEAVHSGLACPQRSRGRRRADPVQICGPYLMCLLQAIYRDAAGKQVNKQLNKQNNTQQA